MSYLTKFEQAVKRLEMVEPPDDYVPEGYHSWSEGMQMVYDFVAAPDELLAEIFDECIKHPKDLCEIGRVAMMVYSNIDRERNQWLAENT